MPKAEWLRRLARYRRPVASDFIASEGAARRRCIRRQRLALSSGRRRRRLDSGRACARIRAAAPVGSDGAAGGDTTGKGTALSPAGEAAGCVPAGGPASLAPAFTASVEADGLRREAARRRSVPRSPWMVTRPPAGQSPELSAHRRPRLRPATEARSQRG